MKNFSYLSSAPWRIHSRANRVFKPLLLVGLLLLPIERDETLRADEKEFSAEQIEFFEKKVRPVLIEHCFECHSSDAEEVKAELLVESRDALLKGGESGPAIVPGRADKSLLIESIRFQSVEMPPNGKLPKGEIESLVRWIEMGAPWPNDGIAPVNEKMAKAADLDWTTLQQSHWAFRKVEKPPVPEIKNSDWPSNEIDRFILSGLKQAGLSPSAPADRRVLIRRVYFDLTGLPPTPDEVEEFVNDSRPLAYEKLIDRLLASPHYGERWGRHWLDVARYSDGQGGFLDNKTQPHAWRYRDWIIDAINTDLPFDQFIRLQIAGDLIDQQKGAVATGFFSLGPTYRSDGGDPEATAQAKSETLDDRIDTLSRGILGLTVSCARCHEHKFDPIPQLDYYSLAGVFNNTNVIIKPIAPQEIIDRYNEAQTQIKDRDKTIREREKELKKDGRMLTEEDKNELKLKRQELTEFKNSAPPLPDSIHAMVDSGSADMKLAIRGNLLKRGPVAPRRLLRIIAGENPERYTQGSGRLELANEITSPDNPLTARVFVNRVWMHHFGKAIVRTPSNFGTLGEKPTHPQLLDWLAAWFVEEGWSLKKLHRKIMLSSSYQMSSRQIESNFKVDGDNRWLWRMNPRRLDVEAWRDTLLSVSGELDKKLGGPPVNNINDPRRTIYMKVSRNGDQTQPDGFMKLFDFPAMRATVAKRSSSAVPQQYLFLMNNDYMVQRAQSLADRLNEETTAIPDQIEHAYRLLYGRAPTATEAQIGIDFLSLDPKNEKPNGTLQIRRYTQALLGSNELMYIE